MKKIKFNRVDIYRIIIYAIVFLMLIIKMNMYSSHLGYFNDELAHISYIAYLEEKPSFIPEFENMKLLSNCDLYEDYSVCSFSDNVNWLGHPPLYYWVMDAMGGISISDNGEINVDLARVRLNTQILACIGVVLAFYLGFKLIKKIVPTFIYALILTSVPMFSCVSAGVNNDTISYIVVLIFFIGIMRFTKENRGYLTYSLIALGITGAGLTKLTTFIMVVIVAILVVGFYLIKERKITKIFNKAFFITAIIYIPVVVYYILMLKNYQSVRFDPVKAGFAEAFIPESERTIHGLLQFIKEYIKMYLITWTRISSHYTVEKSMNMFDLCNIGLTLLFALPFICILFKSNNKYDRKIYAYFLVSYLITMLINFKTCYDTYLTRGYFGGMHSRYYYCILPVLGLLICYQYDGRIKQFFEDKFPKYSVLFNRVWSALWLYFGALLIYDDFLYFLETNIMYN